MGFGTGQKCGIAALIIGSLMCAVGTCLPYWQHGEIDVNTLAQFFSVSIPFFGSIKLATIDIGPWWYCREYLDDKKCEMYDIKEDDSAKVWGYRITSILSVLLSLIGALVGLCQMCCCPGGKTIGHGMCAFLAGGAGAATIALYVTNSNNENKLLQIKTSYDWAFYVYLAGAVIIFSDSFLLCFAAPDNPVGQVFPATAGGTVIVASSTQQMQSYPGPQYAYPNTMYTGQAHPMPTEQQWPAAIPTQPHHHGDTSKPHDWTRVESETPTGR